MKIAVCIVQVPATDARIVIRSDGMGIDAKDIKFVISPYDEFAIEAALQLKEKAGGEVVLITAGPDRAQQALREGLALGADRAVHITHSDEYHDALEVAALLAAAVAKENPELALFGKLGVGFDHGATGVMVAAMLDRPHVSMAAKLELDGTTLKARREIEGAGETYSIPLPAVITAEKGLNTPRIANLKGIMAAKKKPIETLAAADLAPAAPALKLDGLQPPPKKAAGKLITEEDPAKAARELVRLLREEAKVI
jgi:electron transfer flavoprotein beta subunit